MNNYNVTTSEWKAVKEAGVKLFAPEKGGSYEVFEKRPLDPRILAYCAQDVALLPDLEMAILRKVGYLSTLNARVAQKKLVEEESAKRVVASQRVGYNPNPGRAGALARVSFVNRGI
jgi:exonuclease 3'-5' domain-containing protein 1